MPVVHPTNNQAIKSKMRIAGHTACPVSGNTPLTVESVIFLENSMTYGESSSDTATEALPTLGCGEPAEGGVNTRPILGGETSVTLTAAPTLASLGVSVSEVAGFVCTAFRCR
jgi:hypothetical protein